MPWPAEFALLLTVAQLAAPGGDGPRATSGEAARYDRVGYAVQGELADGVAHATLPVGSFVEVTALDSGRTVLVPVRATAASVDLVTLSASARAALGGEGTRLPVRIRAVTPSPQDAAALRNGAAVAPRLDAPPVLLVGLRKQLPITAAPASSAPPAPPTTAARERPVPAPAPRSAGWLVQVATLSDEGRARALARELKGSVAAAGKLWRVRLGPFADQPRAQAARAEAAKRGYGDAQILRSN